MEIQRGTQFSAMPKQPQKLCKKVLCQQLKLCLHDIFRKEKIQFLCSSGKGLPSDCCNLKTNGTKFRIFNKRIIGLFIEE